MIVVADSSPFIALLNIGHIDILPQLFGSVIIDFRITQNVIDLLLKQHAERQEER